MKQANIGQYTALGVKMEITRLEFQPRRLRSIVTKASWAKTAPGNPEGWVPLQG